MEIVFDFQRGKFKEKMVIGVLKKVLSKPLLAVLRIALSSRRCIVCSKHGGSPSFKAVRAFFGVVAPFYLNVAIISVSRSLISSFPLNIESLSHFFNNAKMSPITESPQ